MQLGVDGNCGFALLGDDLQSGEAEFVEIDYNHKEGDVMVLGSHAEMIAAGKAMEALCERLGIDPHRMLFCYGPSHPYGG